MRLYLTESGPVIEEGKALFSLESELSWDELINRENLRSYLNGLRTSFQKYDSEDFLSTVRAPIGNQEVWAAGVTYFSSRLARMEESKDAGGGDFTAESMGRIDRKSFLRQLPREWLVLMLHFESVAIQLGMFRSPNLLYLHPQVEPLRGIRLEMMFLLEV